MKPESQIEHLRDALSRYSAKSVFLVTGDKSFTLSGAEDALKPFLANLRVHRFFEFAENPEIDDVERGLAAFRKQDADVILAVGGGSVIDMAKMINVFAAVENPIEAHVRENQPFERKAKPLIAIPTTAGAGSEATQFATLYIDKQKFSVANKLLLPDVAIVDPVLTHNLPPRLTAISGMDSLSQSIESYWSVHSTDESKGYAREAMGLIIENLSNAVLAPADASRAAMSKAANLAGQAINITRTTAPHALSYSLTSRFGVPHGQAVSFTLPRFLVFNYGVTDADVVDGRGAAYVRKTIEEVAAVLGCRTVPEASAKILSMMKRIGLATTFAELQIDRDRAIETILREVNVERLVNNPRRVTHAQMRELLQAIDNE